MPKLFFKTYWMTITICLIIFILSIVTFKSIPEVAQFHNSDKLMHILMYCSLGFIAYYEFLKDEIFKIKYSFWLFFMFVFFVLFGGLIEILQATVFNPRTGELGDWIADIIGLMIGMGAGWIIRKFLLRK